VLSVYRGYDVLTVFRFRATTGGAGAGGMGNNGGVWEWTSTVFDKCVGFVPSTLYPGYALLSSFRLKPFLTTVGRYSMDFFDGAHQVVVRFFYYIFYARVILTTEG
jgi:formylglycine-generating enzyme required for sulfatase activity